MVCLFLKSVLLMMLRSVSLSMNDVRMNLLIGYQIHILIIVWGSCCETLVTLDYMLIISMMK